MSIFIAVPTLKDPEIVSTIKSAFSNADDPSSVYMGVAAFVDDEFHSHILDATSGIDNLFVDKYDKEINTGVGVGRIYAKARYDGQDLFLQVDSHTYFDRGWDTAASILWTAALKETGNPKTVVSGYLPPYGRKFGIILREDSFFRYSVFTKDIAGTSWNKISWMDLPLHRFYKTDKMFVPAAKVSGTFILSDQHYAESSGHLIGTKLFDEEIIQSIELLSNGYSLAFPNVNIPMYHFYGDERRQTTAATIEEMEAAIDTYVELYPKKCKVWEDYAHVDLSESSFQKWYIPNTYGGE